MTELLKKAFERASKLPEDQQDALAAVVLDELESDQRWAELLANSQDKLAKLADAALDEAKQGKTRPFSEL
jgi:hypothetical protein